MAAAPQSFHGQCYLDNGVIRLGVDLDLGGAITYLSKSNHDENVVNNFDFGRQIQMSYYSGPTPFIVGEKRPAKHWEHLGWNPIQVGDDFGHRSRVIAHTSANGEIYVKCVPLLWPLDNEPGECAFECWIALDGPAARVRCRLNNQRADKKQYAARRQEMPAVYTNAPLYRLMTYSGDQPFTGGPLSRIEKPPGEPGPWKHWEATERWSALVRDDDWGLGVWNPACCSFGGGFAGKPGVGGSRDMPTGYMSPGLPEIIDHDIQHEYEYVLVLGQLAAIRRYVYDHAEQSAKPGYRFEKDRQHWHYVNAHDAGWPIAGELRISLEEDDPQLIGPNTFWRAEDVPRLYLRAACRVQRPAARLYWSSHAERGYAQQRSLEFQFIPDGEFHDYALNLASSPHYRGAITGLRLDPVSSGLPGDYIRIKSLTAAKPAP